MPETQTPTELHLMEDRKQFVMEQNFQQTILEKKLEAFKKRENIKYSDDEED